MIKKRDFIIILMLLVVSAGLFIINKKDEGRFAQIEFNGERYATVEFSSLKEGEVKTFNINGTTINVDKNGAYFAESVCKTHICVENGRITKEGQIVVCLPQRVSVRIIGSDSRFDGITG